jgi:hypothetical protein
VVTRDWLLRDGRSALLVFASPDCGQCAALIPAVAQLHESRTVGVNVVVVTSGIAEAGRRMIGGRAMKIAAVDKGAQLARHFSIAGVPSAVLISPQATIASEAVTGAQAIMRLLGCLTSEGDARE